MKRSYVRSVAALVLAALLSVPALPIAAAPRDDRAREVPNLIARIVQKVQKLFGVRTLSDLPQPPRPDPEG